MHYLIRDLNKDEKPREKLIKFGCVNLTDSELLALILRSGGKEISAIDLAREIITKSNGIQNLNELTIEQLLQIKNIDIAKASSVIACIELGLRMYTSNTKLTKAAINTPKDVYELLKKSLFKKHKEHLFLLSLNSRNKLIASDLISIGTVNEALLSTREIIKQAFARNAVSIIIAHNHPSNDIAPSKEDITATYDLYEICKKVGIPLLDHIIICDDSFSSLKQMSLLDSKKEVRKGVKDKNVH